MPHGEQRKGHRGLGGPMEQSRGHRNPGRVLEMGPERIQVHTGRGKEMGGYRGCHMGWEGAHRGPEPSSRCLVGIEVAEQGTGAKYCRGEQSWRGLGG